MYPAYRWYIHTRLQYGKGILLVIHDMYIIHVTHVTHVTYVSTCVSHVIHVHIIHDLILHDLILNKECCLE